MSKGSQTYTAYNVFFDSGGPWGLFGAVVIAYVDAKLEEAGLKVKDGPMRFAHLFTAISGASQGGINGIAASILCPGKILGYTTYTCALDLFRRLGTKSLAARQILNKGVSAGMTAITRGRAPQVQLLNDHYDHQILYRMLEPYFQDKTMSDAVTSLLIASYNVTKRKSVAFGRLDSDLFTEDALKLNLINGKTSLLSGAMATSSVHGIFMPYEFNGNQFRDSGNVASAGHIHKALDFSLKAKFAATRQPKKENILDWVRNMLPDQIQNYLPAAPSSDGPLTLANADHAVVRTLFLGTGDVRDLPESPAHRRGGMMGAFDDNQFNFLHMNKHHVMEQDALDMERYHDVETKALIGKPAMTIINRSIVPQLGTDEVGKFPAPNPLLCTETNLQKVFYVAGLNVADNNVVLADFLREAVVAQHRQGKFREDGVYDKLLGVCDAIAKDKVWDTLDKHEILVTAQNGPSIYNHFSQEKKRKTAPEPVQAVA